MGMRQRGLLIIILGIDGAGKSSFLQTLRQAKENGGYRYLCLERKQFGTYAKEFHVPLYVEQSMSQLEALLWGARSHDPVEELSDTAWLHLHACWYDVFQQYILQPALLQYDYVFFDSWFYKIMARFLVNPLYTERMLSPFFKDLLPGDWGLMLDTDVSVCLRRKTVLSHSVVRQIKRYFNRHIILSCF